MSVAAVLLVLGAAVAHAAWNVIAHGASRAGLPFLWCGSVVSTLLWLPIVPLTGGLSLHDLGGFALGVGVSAVLHVIYMLVLQRGYAVGNLSTVYATARGTGPLLTVIVAIVVLGERPSPLALVGVAAIIAGVIGIGLVDRAPTAGARRGVDPAILFGLVTGVAIAAYTLWDAQALRTWDVSPVAFMVGCTALEIPLFTALLGRRLPRVVPLARREWRRMVTFGILSPLSYILVLAAVTIAPVALVAPMREVSVVLVSLFGALVLKEARPAARLAASGVVVAGIALLAV
jgi:drug/metabolite transporter (DMT)-like permease